jgi:hypothetical protein
VKARDVVGRTITEVVQTPPHSADFGGDWLVVGFRLDNGKTLHLAAVEDPTGDTAGVRAWVS